MTKGWMEDSQNRRDFRRGSDPDKKGPRGKKKSRKPWKIIMRYKPGMAPDWLVRLRKEPYAWTTYGRYKQENDAQKALNDIISKCERAELRGYYSYDFDHEFRLILD